MVEDEVGVGTGPLPPRSSFAQAARPHTSMSAIQERCQVLFHLMVQSAISGTGKSDGVPMPVVAVRVSVTEAWPIGNPAAENGKLPCHCPAPILCSDAIGSSEFGPKVSCATFVVVIAAIVIVWPFLTTDGET